MKALPSKLKRIQISRWICSSCQRNFTQSHVFKHTSSTVTALPQLPKEPARTRFAPSPTGYLHLGSLRTALYNYLIAKATHGKFILRVEDTDQKRTIPDAEQRLFQDLEWAGIEWDEGPRIGGPYGSYKQSERTPIYIKYATELLESGNAYRCFCPPERLHQLAEHRNKLGLPPDYDRTCAHVPKEESDDRASKGASFVVRFKAPDTYPDFHDLVYCLVRQKRAPKLSFRDTVSIKSSYEDPILLKSDGYPTYHLANVVDDHLMKITHVIRGSEWMSSTPKHLALYEALGWEPPAFAHVGLLLDTNKQKLSKRHGAIDVASFRNMGVFPETLTNFLALLGWSHGGKSDVMSLEELIKNASMKFTKGDSVVTPEKLWFLQRRHAGRYALVAESGVPVKPLHDLNELAVKPIVQLLDKKHDYDRFHIYQDKKGFAREEYIRLILFKDAAKYTNPPEFIIRNAFFFCAPSPDILQLRISSIKIPSFSASIAQLPSVESIPIYFDSLIDIPVADWKESRVRSWVDSVVDHGEEETLRVYNQATTVIIEGLTTEVNKRWNSLVHQYLRWALSAGMPGPDGATTILLLGKEEVISRLERAKGIWASTYKASLYINVD